MIDMTRILIVVAQAAETAQAAPDAADRVVRVVASLVLFGCGALLIWLNRDGRLVRQLVGWLTGIPASDGDEDEVRLAGVGHFARVRRGPAPPL